MVFNILYRLLGVVVVATGLLFNAQVEARARLPYDDGVDAVMVMMM